MRTKSKDIRERMIASAMECYRKYGVINSSMDIVAKRAGTTKPTVYSHFGSKDGLFDAVIETLQHNFLENPSLVYDKEKDAAEQLVSFFNEQLISLFDQDYIELLRAIILETTRKNHNIPYDDLQMEFDVRNWIEDAIEYGDMEPCDVVMAANNLIGIVNGRFFYPALIGIRQFSKKKQKQELRKSIEEFLGLSHRENLRKFGE